MTNAQSSNNLIASAHSNNMTQHMNNNTNECNQCVYRMSVILPLSCNDAKSFECISAEGSCTVTILVLLASIVIL